MVDDKHNPPELEEEEEDLTPPHLRKVDGKKTPRPPMVRSGRTLTYPVELIAKGFRLYAMGWCLRDIADRLGVHENTVKVWRKEREWDRLAAQVFKGVMEKTQVDVIESVSQSLQLIQNWKAKLLMRMEHIPPHKIPVTMLADLPELNRIEQQLMGQAIARPGEELPTKKSIQDHLQDMLHRPAHTVPAALVKCQQLGLDPNATTVAEVLAASQLEHVIEGNMKLSEVDVPETEGSLEEALKKLSDT